LKDIFRVEKYSFLLFFFIGVDQIFKKYKLMVEACRLEASRVAEKVDLHCVR